MRLASEGSQLPASVPDDVRQRAEAYASGRLPVALLLAREPSAGAHEEPAADGPEPVVEVSPMAPEREAAVPADPGPPDPDPETPPEFRDVVSSNGDTAVEVPRQAYGALGAPVSRLRAVRRQHALQLVRYLTKTSYVPGPRTDLIHLESASATFGLRPEDAERLERAALDGVAADVLTLIERLTEATEERRQPGSRARSKSPVAADAVGEADRAQPTPVAAYRFLASIAEDSAVGVEAANVISTLLRAYLQLETDLRPYTDDVLDAVLAHFDGVRTRTLDVAASLMLAISAESGSANALLELALNAADDTDDEVELLDDELATRLAERLMAHADRIIPLNEDLYASLSEEVLVRSPRALDLLLALAPASADRAVELAADELRSTFRGAHIGTWSRETTEAFLSRAPELEQGLREAQRGSAADVVHGSPATPAKRSSGRGRSP